MSSTTVRSGTPALVGGTLWALLPVVFTLAPIEDTARGTLSFLAVAIAYWAVGILSLLLLLVGLSGLRGALGGTTGRLGTTGLAVSGLALVAMLLGNGTEMTTLTFTGAESDLGHSVFLVGFLVLVVGSLLLGIALLRSRPAVLVRWAGAVLVAMLPLGVGLAVLGGILFPTTDAGFWAALTVPYGVAWILLGRFHAVPRTMPAGDPARVS
jgi:hypothetical protein